MVMAIVMVMVMGFDNCLVSQYTCIAFKIRGGSAITQKHKNRESAPESTRKRRRICTTPKGFATLFRPYFARTGIRADCKFKLRKSRPRKAEARPPGGSNLIQITSAGQQKKQKNPRRPYSSISLERENERERERENNSKKDLEVTSPKSLQLDNKQSKDTAPRV